MTISTQSGSSFGSVVAALREPNEKMIADAFEDVLSGPASLRDCMAAWRAGIDAALGE